MKLVVSINIVCMMILIMTIYFVAGKRESREKKLIVASMMTSLAYCVVDSLRVQMPFKVAPNGVVILEILSVLLMGALFIFYFQYMLCVTGYRVRRSIIAAFMSVYALGMAFLLTSSYHHFFYKKLQVVEKPGDEMLLRVELGVGFYLFYFLMVVTAVLIICMAYWYYKKAGKINEEERGKRAKILFCVSFIPVFIIVPYFLDFRLKSSLTCVGMGVTGIFLTYALNRYNYMNIIQSARDMVVENMNLGLLIFDKEYQVLEVNQFMRERFYDVWKIPGIAYKSAELKSLLDGEKDKLEWKGRIYSCLRNEVYSQSHVMIGYALTLYDITDMENNARELRIMKEKAERASEQKTKFLANVTHEIRTPLNTILGMSEIALRNNVAKDLEAPLKNIYHEGKNVIEMIDTLLDVSRIESGEIKLTTAKYDMEEIIYDISNMVYMKIDEKDLEYKVEIEPNFPRSFYGDRMRVKEIFQNLLGNAIKYTECGRVTLNLGGEKEEDGRYKIVLTVTDTGVGMSENDKENIFQRFKRSSNPKTENVFGVGLGLDITMNLVKLMGGTIQVQSCLNEGSSFRATFYQEIADSEPLWIKKMTKENAVNHVGNDSFMDEIHVVFPGAHVLVVDDMSSNLKVEQGLLQLYGIEPEMALSGKEALELVQSRHYDLIFMDHLMPEMDGVETLEKIRELEKEVPVIAVTANATVYTKAFYEENGFDGCLTKPLQTDELLNVLKKYLSSRIQNKEIEELEENLPIKNLMPKIDCVAGIKNIGGNLDSYNELLKVYYREMAQILETLPDLAQESLEQFKIKVHGVKGSSRNVGAKELSERALQLEEWAKEGKQKEVLDALDDFLKEMDAVMTRVDTYLKDTVETVERDGDFLPELELTSVYKILQALSEFDMDIVEDEMKELYRNRYTDDTEVVLEELKRYIEELDYKHATELLKDYLKKIG